MAVPSQVLKTSQTPSTSSLFRGGAVVVLGSSCDLGVMTEKGAPFISPTSYLCCSRSRWNISQLW